MENPQNKVYSGDEGEKIKKKERGDIPKLGKKKTP